MLGPHRELERSEHRIPKIWITLGIAVLVGLFGAVGLNSWNKASARAETSIHPSDWRGGGARGNHEVHETYARTADGVLVLVETWHDLRIDPDKWNLPVVVVTAVRSATAGFTVDSIVNHHDNFTTKIIRDAQYLVGNTNIRIVVNTVSWECPGEPRPLCMTEQ